MALLHFYSVKESFGVCLRSTSDTVGIGILFSEKGPIIGILLPTTQTFAKSNLRLDSIAM
jgi:hypothetical protein